MKIRVLGCSGAIARGCRTTAFLADHDILIDAGTGVGDLSLDELAQIDHVFLTHSHLDHIAALPLMVDAVAAQRHTPLQVHALPDTLRALHAHIFNDTIWPDFTRIPHPERPFLQFVPLHLGEVMDIGNKRIEVLPACHTVPATAYAVAEIKPVPKYWVFSGDTSHHPLFWEAVNRLPVGMLVIETAFSEKEKRLADVSRHLSPTGLDTGLSCIDPSTDYPIWITHTKPAETTRIMAEIAHINAKRMAAGVSAHDIGWLSAGQLLDI